VLLTTTNSSGDKTDKCKIQGRIKASVSSGAVPNVAPYTAHNNFALPPIVAPKVQVSSTPLMQHWWHRYEI